MTILHLYRTPALSAYQTIFAIEPGSAERAVPLKLL